MLPALARWRVRQDRVDDPRDLLVPACSRFTEGFTTADLRSALKKLEALCHDAVPLRTQDDPLTFSRVHAPTVLKQGAKADAKDAQRSPGAVSHFEPTF